MSRKSEVGGANPLYRTGVPLGPPTQPFASGTFLAWKRGHAWVSGGGLAPLRNCATQPSESLSPIEARHCTSRAPPWPAPGPPPAAAPCLHSAGPRASFSWRTPPAARARCSLRRSAAARARCWPTCRGRRSWSPARRASSTGGSTGARRPRPPSPGPARTTPDGTTPRPTGSPPQSSMTRSRWWPTRWSVWRRC